MIILQKPVSRYADSSLCDRGCRKSGGEWNNASFCLHRLSFEKRELGDRLGNQIMFTMMILVARQALPALRMQPSQLFLESRMMPTNILIEKKTPKMMNLTTTIFLILGQMYLTAQGTVTRHPLLLAGVHLVRPPN